MTQTTVHSHFSLLRLMFQMVKVYIYMYITRYSLLTIQIRGHMASLGIRKFQDLVGRTDLLRVGDTGNPKAKTLNFSLILKNALHMRPGVNIVGGSQRQV
jgi:glutamate synthase (NADPH/NADH)